MYVWMKESVAEGKDEQRLETYPCMTPSPEVHVEITYMLSRRVNQASLTIAPVAQASMKPMSTEKEKKTVTPTSKYDERPLRSRAGQTLFTYTAEWLGEESSVIYDLLVPGSV